MRVTARSTTLCILILFCSMTAANAEVAYAYVHLNVKYVKNVKNYKASNAQAYNPTGGAVIISRRAPGRFIIDFQALAKARPKRSRPPYVQVTTVGFGMGRCRPIGWGIKGADLVVDVACSDAQDRPLDGRFNLLAGWPQEGISLPKINPIPKHPRPSKCPPDAGVSTRLAISGI